MALDFEKLKRAQAELQARMNQGGPSMKFWKPAPKKNTVRILPAWTEEGEFADQFFREVHQHWNLTENSGPVLCPKKTPYAADEKDCPICDLVESLRARKGDVEAQQIVKDMRAKVAYLFSIIDIDDPEYTAKDIVEWKKDRPDSDCPFEVGDPKIQCYAAGTTVANDIMNIVIANGMDITNLTEGNNVYITKIPNKDPMKTRYTVTPEIKKTKAPVKEDVKLPDLAKIGKVHAYDDLVKLLDDSPASALLTSGSSSESKGGYRDQGRTKAIGAGSGPDLSKKDSSWLDGEGGGDLADEMRSQLG